MRELQPPPPRRLWLAPAIALGLALLLLLILLWPNVLITRRAGEEAHIQALRDSNRTLEDEIARMRRAEAGGICTYDGELFPGSVEQAAWPPTPEQRLELLPPPPETVKPEAGALPEDSGFDGEIDDLLRASTVLVIAKRGVEITTGSGFFIGPRHIVTNAHVVEGAEEIIVSNQLIGAPLRATLVARKTPDAATGLPQQDFALLGLAADVATAVPLTLAPALRSQRVYASHYPIFNLANQTSGSAAAGAQQQPTSPLQALVSDGIVTTVQRVELPEGPVWYLPHTAPIPPGNSGGPLVDLCGRAVGINTASAESAASDLALEGQYALASDGLANFLRQTGVDFRMTQQPCAAGLPQ